MAESPLLGQGLVARRVSVPAKEVVYVKAILEASQGFGALFAERGGDLIVAAPVSRAVALDELLRDLVAEVGAVVQNACALESVDTAPARDNHPLRHGT